MKLGSVSAAAALLVSSVSAAPMVVKRASGVTDLDILQYALTVGDPQPEPKESSSDSLLA